MSGVAVARPAFSEDPGVDKLVPVILLSRPDIMSPPRWRDGSPSPARPDVSDATPRRQRVKAATATAAKRGGTRPMGKFVAHPLCKWRV